MGIRNSDQIPSHRYSEFDRPHHLLHTHGTMPTPLSPTSSQEIIPISPPTASTSTLKRAPVDSTRRSPRKRIRDENADPSDLGRTTLPRAAEPFEPTFDLKMKVAEWMRGEAPRVIAKKDERVVERDRIKGRSRDQTTQRMVCLRCSWIRVAEGLDVDAREEGQSHH